MEQIFDDFIELHGDRYYRDDPAIVGGIASLDGQPVTVIGVHKGNFNRPIITFVNTSGAFCGMEAEEGGQESVPGILR